MKRMLRESAADLVMALVFALCILIVAFVYRSPGYVAMSPSINPFFVLQPERVTETPISEAMWSYAEILFRMRVRHGSVSFFYGSSQRSLRPMGGEYPMACGGWTGARPGLFVLNTQGRWGGWADVKYVKISNE